MKNDWSGKTKKDQGLITPLLSYCRSINDTEGVVHKKSYHKFTQFQITLGMTLGSVYNRLCRFERIGKGEIDIAASALQTLRTSPSGIGILADGIRIVTDRSHRFDNLVKHDILAGAYFHRSTCPTNLDILFKILPPRRNPRPHAS